MDFDMNPSSDRPTISLLGLTIPISPWSISLFSGIAVIGVAMLVYRQLSPTDLVTLKQANAQLDFEVREYGRHISDTPERVFTDPDGSLMVQVYADHCVMIQRKSVQNGISTKLIPDPSRTPSFTAIIPTHPQDWMPVVEAQGQCWNPHPGAFTTSYGTRSGCIVEVWRQFYDGCVHVQMLNSCTGYWDANPDGSPRVRWTRCVH